jgi:N-acetylneuraminic acid mutarotase
VGLSSVISGEIDDVEMFDIMTNKWTIMHKLPVPIGVAAAIVVHNGILLLGSNRHAVLSIEDY